jgi:orotidine-5'-phosphate decarboxylase
MSRNAGGDYIMTREELYKQIRAKRSFLCVGLDTDINKIPEHLVRKFSVIDPATGELNHTESILEFNKAIIDVTARYSVAYKPNLAFYEARANEGMDALGYTCAYIKDKYPEILVIADAKRGDIGNTSEMYADAFFGYEKGEGLFDAVTLSPYMGRDTVDPFLKYEDKWAVILALTSNKSADDFETLQLANGDPLWKEVLRKASRWGTPDNTMFVVGATRAETLKEVREIVPDHFLLVPGVGAQGGSLAEVAENGMNSKCGLLVNSSRGIIYADNGENFAQAAAREAQKMQAEMSTLLDKYLKL